MERHIWKFALFAAIAGVMYAVAFCVYPVARLAFEINSDQRRIMYDVDHNSIRDSSIKLLSDPTDRYIELKDLPEPISLTDPHYVHVSNDVVYIEYGGGFLHYGLIVAPNGYENSDVQKLSDDVYFYVNE